MFFRLIQNEMMKIMHKKTWRIFIYAFLLLNVLATLSYKLWFPEAGRELNVLGYMNEVGFMLSAIVGIYAIIIGAQILTNEYKEGTIKQLLIRSASRTEILFSKYVGGFLAILVLYLILFTITGICGLMFGFGGEGEISSYIVLKKFLYALPETMFYVAFSLMLATLFRSGSLAITIAIIGNFMGGIAAFTLARYEWSKYIIFANLDLAGYDAETTMNGKVELFQPGMSLGFSLGVIAVYTIVSLVISLVVFKKRDIS